MTTSTRYGEAYCGICGNTLDTGFSCPSKHNQDHTQHSKTNYRLSKEDFDFLQKKIDNPDESNKNLYELFKQFS